MATASARPRTRPGASHPPGRRPLPYFDDFNYSNRRELAKRGWIVRNVAGWPGVPGATCWGDGITVVSIPEAPGNRILRMTSSTDGTGINTTQAQLCHQRKYLEGTYAARVRFSDHPTLGPGGDQVVQASTRSARWLRRDPDSRAGFGVPAQRRLGHPAVPLRDHVGDVSAGAQLAGRQRLQDHAGNQAAGGTSSSCRCRRQGAVFRGWRGARPACRGEYYPESTMSINFNLWFIKDGAATADDRPVPGGHRLGLPRHERGRVARRGGGEGGVSAPSGA